MTGGAAELKSQLRVTVEAARQRLPESTRMQAGLALARHGVGRWQAADTIAAYLSVGIEPPTRDLLEALVARGTRVLLPVIDALALDWAEYVGPAALTAGPLGLTEPTTPRLGVDAVEQADVVLVPALAVDRMGNRLGRGRGYYDRALIDVAAPIIAVLYDGELIEQVPAEAHDHRVDAVLTPSGLTRLN
jgi:5-formyltetrahydrofolate cyclo-ligase